MFIDNCNNVKHNNLKLRALDSWEFVETIKQIGQAYAHLPSMNLFVEMAENSMRNLQKYKREHLGQTR